MPKSPQGWVTLSTLRKYTGPDVQGNVDVGSQNIVATRPFTMTSNDSMIPLTFELLEALVTADGRRGQTRFQLGQLPAAGRGKEIVIRLRPDLPVTSSNSTVVYARHLPLLSVAKPTSSLLSAFFALPKQGSSGLSAPTTSSVQMTLPFALSTWSPLINSALPSMVTAIHSFSGFSGPMSFSMARPLHRARLLLCTQFPPSHLPPMINSMLKLTSATALSCESPRLRPSLQRMMTPPMMIPLKSKLQLKNWRKHSHPSFFQLTETLISLWQISPLRIIWRCLSSLFRIPGLG